MNRHWSIFVLRLALGLVAGGYSLALVLSQLYRVHAIHHVMLLVALTELTGAILMLIPKTVRLGAILLIATFVFAAVFHLLEGEYNVANLAVYSAAALVIVFERR